MNTIIKLLSIAILSIILLAILGFGLLFVMNGVVESQKSPEYKRLEMMWINHHGTPPPPGVIEKVLKSHQKK